MLLDYEIISIFQHDQNATHINFKVEFNIVEFIVYLLPLCLPYQD